MRRSTSRLAGLTVLLLVAAVLSSVSAAGAAPSSKGSKVQVVQVTRVVANDVPTATSEKVQTSVTIKNTTGKKQPAGTAKLFLFNDKQTLQLGTRPTPSLADGKVATVSATYAVPAAAKAGRYAVRVCLVPRQAGGCRGSAASVDVAPAKLAASPTALVLGDVLVGATSPAKRVRITNQGSSGTGALTKTLTGASDFDLASSTCGAALLPGATCTVDITLTPTSAGPLTGNLRVTGGAGGTVNVPLAGNGAGDAALSVDPGSVDFDGVLVGETSDATVLTVTNDGDITSGVPDVSVDTDGSPFTVTGTNCTTALAPGDSCMLNVVFAPTTNGSFLDSVDIAAQPGGTATAGLSGTGLAAASLSISPQDVEFVDTTVDQTSNAETLTVTNDGDVTSGVPTVELGGDGADQFAITDDTCTDALDAGDSCTVDVVSAPTVTGESSAQVRVVATPGGTATADLSGTGQTEPALSIDQDGYDFAYTDAPTEHVFTITNDGTVTSGPIDTDVTGDPAFAITADTCTAPLAGGGTCTVGVTYTGTGTDVQEGQLVVTSTEGGTVSADLAGSPVALSVSPASHDFGDVLVGSSSESESFTLTNHRLTTVQVDGEGVTGPFPLDSSCFPVILPAGATCTFTAHFTPTTGGQADGFLDYFAQGVRARVEVSGSGETPAALSVNPGTVDIGAYAPGDVGTQQVSITNTGTRPTDPISFSITGADAIEFYTDSTDCPTTLAGGATCTVTVGFAPVALGDKTASFTVSGAPGGTVALVALAAPPGVTLFPVTHNYGATAVGGASYFTYRVVNTTNSGEDMNSASSGPPFPLELNQDFTCVLVISTIQPHRWCTMTLSFKPQSPGSFQTTLTAGGTNFNTQAQLSGTGVPARPAAPRPGAAGAAGQSVTGEGVTGEGVAGSPTKNWVLAIRNGEPVVG